MNKTPYVCPECRVEAGFHELTCSSYQTENEHDWHEFEPIDGDPYHERCMCGLVRSVIDQNNARFA